jgi:hypothetical protein
MFLGKNWDWNVTDLRVTDYKYLRQVGLHLIGSQTHFLFGPHDIFEHLSLQHGPSLNFVTAPCVLQITPSRTH